MNILVSNDDGYLSPGIQVLANALSTLGQVTIVA
ncbi:MAG: 5'/3'-nucleotidase SurE, partial [Halothiobacillaceae bacterium]